MIAQQKIPEKICNLLIQIGSRGEMLDQYREQLKGLDWINRMGPQSWKEVSQPLEQRNCELLIYGLVIVERELEWLGGSVSGAIWVYHVYEERFPPSHIDVANWVLQNRGRNEYLPFGSHSNARSYDEYVAECLASQRRSQDHVVRQNAQIEEKNDARKNVLMIMQNVWRKEKKGRR